MELIQRVESLDDLESAAKWILENLNGRKIIAINGEMGAGKTTFVKALCAFMGVKDEVTSPTFSLVNEYDSEAFGKIYHFDFYRIEDEEEVWNIGLDDYLYSSSFCFIEWPEKICNFIPPESAELNISLEGHIRVFQLKLPPNE